MKTFSHLKNYEFRSKEEISGWPLIHINFGTDPATGRPKVAKGIVAIGNFAIGIVSIGTFALGVVTLAGIGLGIVSLASIAVGVVAFGAIALGYEVSIGAVVLSAKFSLGATTLDPNIVMLPLLLAAFLVLVIWGLSRFMAD